tara:strand:+ start:73581 stop:74117 length:537 start_codon:yes stop_codon:yes gene_type:complete
VTANSDIEVRGSTPADQAAIVALYPRAFPDEDLRSLVTALLNEDEDVVSLVAESGGAILGHAVFTVCGLEKGSDRQVALLGPLCVDPGHQRQGIGGALIRKGFGCLGSLGIIRICVLGDPAYYGQFGFAPETGIDTPYPLPAEWHNAWQAMNLKNDGEAPNGRMIVPAPWRNPALWGS